MAVQKILSIMYPNIFTSNVMKYMATYSQKGQWLCDSRQTLPATITAFFKFLSIKEREILQSHIGLKLILKEHSLFGTFKSKRKIASKSVPF